jgi:hypothetical protein
MNPVPRHPRVMAVIGNRRAGRLRGLTVGDGAVNIGPLTDYASEPDVLARAPDRPGRRRGDREHADPTEDLNPTRVWAPIAILRPALPGEAGWHNERVPRGSQGLCLVTHRAVMRIVAPRPPARQSSASARVSGAAWRNSGGVIAHPSRPRARPGGAFRSEAA